MISRLLSFLDSSAVNFCAVDSIVKRLTSEGFELIDPSKPLPELTPGKTLMMTKNGTALFAVRIGSAPIEEAGFKLICAHCDSPTFRVKPHAEIRSEGNVVRLNVEVYGGPIMSTWFDRPLSLAGRVILRGKSPLHPVSRVLKIDRPLLTIPNLAIHFNRQVNKGVEISVQHDMMPVLCANVQQQLESNSMLTSLICNELNVQADDIIDFDLYLYDTTPACLVGINNELISSGRLDDLSMVHAGMEALIAAETSRETQVLAIFDNEETGSSTKQGAHSPVLRMLLERLCGCDNERFYRALELSFMVSADNAHALHPNNTAKYDPTNHPVMGGGPVIKYNASQKYTSDADSAAVFRLICQQAGVPCQTFVNNSDVKGGSTLGNILTVQLPIRSVDMGNPIWAMHSVRETGNVADHIFCIKAFTQFYNA